MRIVSCYCPHCEANVMATCTLEGETSLDACPATWVPCIVVTCSQGHPILRLGVDGGDDPVVDTLLARRGVPA